MTEINNGQQNKSAPQRSLLDYSLVACFTLIVLMAILVLDAFEYITVPGAKSARGKLSALSGGMSSDEASKISASMTSAELEEAQKQINEAKALLESKTADVEKIVEKVEEEIKEEKVAEAAAAGVAAPAVPTPEEKKEEEVKKVAVVKAVVEEELSIDTFCGGCRYGQMGFTCATRVDWMMTAYGLTEDMAKESACSKCCIKRGHRGLRREEGAEVRDIETRVREIYEDWEL